MSWRKAPWQEIGTFGIKSLVWQCFTLEFANKEEKEEVFERRFFAISLVIVIILELAGLHCIAI